MDTLRLGLLLTALAFLTALLSTVTTIYYINNAVSIPNLNFSSPTALVDSIKSYLEGLLTSFLQYYIFTFSALTIGFVVAVLGQLFLSHGFIKRGMALGAVASIIGSIGGILALVGGAGTGLLISSLVTHAFGINVLTLLFIGSLGVFAVIDYFLYVFTLNLLVGIQLLMSEAKGPGMLLIFCSLVQFFTVHTILTQTGQYIEVGLETLLFISYLWAAVKLKPRPKINMPPYYQPYPPPYYGRWVHKR
ncbi:hypothetical protein [Stygiolobus caldivivus]|uniref:Uncharacterized protein n=1 Tax=Stygiolobus caldivivus TaxID=2824673 RepID=A0A8D5U8V4_9CREN|nr:hypothetical protein [Stygiolobus caldivivus]BCU71508.1 hypothetical protein KN1_28050 [Stygiolobus caldivivus]